MRNASSAGLLYACNGACFMRAHPLHGQTLVHSPPSTTVRERKREREREREREGERLREGERESEKEGEIEVD